MRFSGKTALVTGGSQGIGEAVSRRLTEEGAEVAIVASSNLEKAKKVADRIGGGAKAYTCDVRDADAAARLAADVARDFGQIDILVNAAGVFYPTAIGDTPRELSDRMIDINLKGTWHMVNAVAPAMQERKAGKIINFSSVAGVMGLGNYALYCATKAGIIMMTRALANELAPHGINVNCVAPGNTASPMNEDIRTSPDLKPMLDFMAARTPSGQTYSSVDDIANVVLFLASAESRAMHGSCLLADEGFSAGM